MSNLIIPKDYTPLLDKIQTEKGIKLIKDFFQQNLATELRLRRVTAINIKNNEVVFLNDFQNYLKLNNS